MSEEQRRLPLGGDQVNPRRIKPNDVTITEGGRHVLRGTKDFGDTCRIRLYPDFVGEPRERLEALRELRDAVPWQEKWGLTRSGERFRMPRLMAWYGPMPYRFSGTQLPPDDQWPPVVRRLHDRVRTVASHGFNSVLLNLYRDGHDGVAWHSDDELLMGCHPVIASLSFGCTRTFEMREKCPSEEESQWAQHVKVPLKDGSLLIMEGETQAHWQHRIPREFHDRDVRVNLTFRTVFPRDP